MALAANALTTYANVKAELGLTDDTQQSYIERQINVVSQKIENYCNRIFKSTTYTNEKYIGNNLNVLTLKQYPVTTLSKVTLDGTEIDLNSLILDGNSGMIEFTNAIFESSNISCGISNYPFLCQKNITVTYTAGYATIPYDLEEICIREVVNAYENKGTTKDLKSWSLGNVSKTYSEKNIDKVSGLLNESKSMLDSFYRKYVI
jgi:hypothetical protein